MSKPKTGTSPSPELYTSTEVRNKLGISSSTLTSLVDKGVIQRLVPPGKKQGYYSKASVDEYAREQNLFLQAISAGSRGGLQARIATIEDEKAIFEMEVEVLGRTVPLETRLIWLHKNPEVDIVVAEDGIIYGHLSLLPLKEDILWKKIDGLIYGKDIEEEDVESYEPGKQYNLFVMAMAARQYSRDRYIYAGLLLREAERLLFELANRAILVKTIYATSRTRDGIYLANKLQMTRLDDHSERHRTAFVLDMAKSKSEWAVDYRKELIRLQLPHSMTEGILSGDDSFDDNGSAKPQTTTDDQKSENQEKPRAANTKGQPRTHS